MDKIDCKKKTFFEEINEIKIDIWKSCQEYAVLFEFDSWKIPKEIIETTTRFRPSLIQNLISWQKLTLQIIFKPAYKTRSLTHRKCRSKANMWKLLALLLIMKKTYGPSEL